MSGINYEWVKTVIDKEAPTIFDIGAYDFHDSTNIRRFFPNANIYAFEAYAYNCEKFGKIASNHNINVFNLAISDKVGKTKFYNSVTMNGTNWTCSGSILQPTKEEGVTIHPGLKYNREGIDVDTVTIEYFCEENNITSVDFIHMDIQGAEYYAIKGMGKKIKPKIIYCETFEYDSYENSLSRDDLDNLMFSLGYSIKERFTYDTLYILN